MTKKKTDRLKWVEQKNPDGETYGYEAQFEGLTLRISDSLMGVTLSIDSPPKPGKRYGSTLGIPGCPSVADAKRIARKEALNVLKWAKKKAA